MMSCTTLAAWSHHVSSPYYTKHGQRCGAILSGRITTVAMCRSGQLVLHYTVEPNCSGLSARLAVVSVTRDRALDTCEPSCVPGAARPFLFLWSTARWGRGVRGSTRALRSGRRGRGHMAVLEPTSIGRRGLELRNTWQHQSSPLGEAEPGAMRHMTALQPTSRGRRGPKLRNTWQHRSPPLQGSVV
jgi:hypothetical protein